MAEVDLWLDTERVTEEFVASCKISAGPRAMDGSFDPQPGELVVLDDAQQMPIDGLVIDRQGDDVTVQILEVPRWVLAKLAPVLRARLARLN